MTTNSPRSRVEPAGFQLPGRGLLEWVGRRGRQRGRRCRHRHRPGRLGPHSSILERLYRAQADLWPRSLHRNRRARSVVRPCRPPRALGHGLRTLEAIAGADGLDPRQGAVPPEEYTEILNTDPANLTIGVLEEGFGHDESEAGVDETVDEALKAFADVGADLRQISVPMHRDGLAIWNGIVTEETAATIAGEGIGHFGNGYYDTELMAAFGRTRRERADEFLLTVKLVVALGEYLAEEYHGCYYAKAQNLSRDLVAAYDDALADVDVLAMPTTPQTAHEHLEDPSWLQILERAVNMLANTSPFDVTGHPALSVPVGTSEGLPVGLMFVGEAFDDATVLQAGDAFEQHCAEIV